MSPDRELLRDALGRERAGDLDGSTSLYQRLLIEFPTFALEKKIDSRLLAMWRKAIETNSDLYEAGKMVQQQIYVQANEPRVKCLALASLGDLDRYSGKMDQASRFYQQAITVTPAIGKPYNQLGVVQASHDSSSSQLLAIHGFLRGLWAQYPFAPARSNLLHAFTTNRTALDRSRVKIADRFNRLLIRLAELSFLGDEVDDDPEPVLADLNAAARALALSCDSIPNLSYILVIFLGLAEQSTLAWRTLIAVFGWQMTSLALTTAPRTDLVLAVFCISACRHTDRLKDAASFLLHLSRLANTLNLDGLDGGANGNAGPKIAPPSHDATCLELFRGFAPIESIPGWASVVDGLYDQPDFLPRSVKTLATLVMHLDPATGRFELAMAPALVVLDLPNICMNHGRNRVFSCRGFALAVHYFQSRGLRVAAFVPEQCLDYEKVATLKRLGRLEGWAAKASSMPDDINLLRMYYANGIISTTPQGDYDDSYTIEHARRNGAVIVSNDRFRDASQKQTDAVDGRILNSWLRSNVCSFTFAGDQFIPNPDFSWPSSHEALIKLAT